MSEHRWSGWPGAMCLDCGVEDMQEVCMAECWKGPTPNAPHRKCPDHINGPCPEPGSRRCDPYADDESS
jgi:hypothetical protein